MRRRPFCRLMPQSNRSSYVTVRALERALFMGALSLGVVAITALLVLIAKSDESRTLLSVAVLVEIVAIGAGFAQVGGSLIETLARVAENQTEILDRLAGATEFRDDDSGRHTQRVGELAARIADALHLPRARIELIRRAAPLHDVGKIGVPDGILFKPGKLTERETAIIRSHTLIGSRLLAGGHSDIVKMAERIARSHHERWDGTGYPDGLKGNAIPLEARIVAVADVFDALRSDRPFRKAWSLEMVLDEIRRLRGRHFDPAVVDAFLSIENYPPHTAEHEAKTRTA